MKSEQNVPQVRFKGFTDAWEQRELGKCFSERVESMPNGELISVTINDGIKKFSELGRHDNSNDDKSKYKKVCVGDIAYNSMRMWQGASGYSPYEGIVSPAYTVLSPNDGVYSKCVAYQFKLPQMIHIFQINSQGITSDNWNLKYPTLSEIEIYISSNLEEQKKIAELFTNLDNLITLHQRKCDTLQKLKKSMLQKMFPKNGSLYPEIRFAGFTDAWEQRELLTIVDVLDGDRGKNYPAESDFTASGHTLFLNASNVTKDGFSFIDNQYISENKSDSMGNGKLQEDDIVVTSRGSLGHIAWYNADIMRYIHHARINSGMLILRKKTSLDSSYLYQFMKSHKGQEQISFISFGSAQPQLTKSGVEKLNVDLPSDIEEQTRIGSFFLHLDTLITLHQRKLETLKKLKKSMLQKMFI